MYPQQLRFPQQKVGFIGYLAFFGKSIPLVHHVGRLHSMPMGNFSDGTNGLIVEDWEGNMEIDLIQGQI